MFAAVLVQVGIWLFPWFLRRWLMSLFWGYDIAPTAKIGMSIILAKHLKMAEGARIGHLTFCKNIDLLSIGKNSFIGSNVYITGFPVRDDFDSFKHRPERKCELVLGESVSITSRHYIDCNGGVYVGDFTTIAGLGTQILTHSIDIYKNRQDAESVIIGKYCFVSTGCIILKGTILPSYSVLAAGAVLASKYTEEGWLYGGVPAKPIKTFDKKEVVYFHRTEREVK